MSDLGVEKRGCTCKWMGDWIIDFDRDCPRFEMHMDRLDATRVAEAKLAAIRERALGAEAGEFRDFVLGITGRAAQR